MRWVAACCLSMLTLQCPAVAQGQAHEHPAPEKLGKVTFPTSCSPEVQANFERGVALLHSFAYTPASDEFRHVETADPQCAIAFWGEAMANFHTLWDPPLIPGALERGKAALDRAHQLGAKSEREQAFIAALTPIFDGSNSVPYRARALRHEEAMRALAARFPDDTETQVFFALALLATVSPDDKSHRNQKEAVGILEPLYQKLPQHPGIAHYLIHACDNAELAPRGLAPARDYSKIAPSAPHALHMPSHIFTRLGMWSDSIHSNIDAQAAAHQQDDVGEELHAMDYLVYAYLQTAHYEEASAVLRQLGNMKSLDAKDFKVSYAATAMPVRYAVERHEWADASQGSSPAGAPAHVAAVAAWARAVGFARAGNTAAARKEIDILGNLENQLREAGSDYWAVQVPVVISFSRPPSPSAPMARQTGRLFAVFT